jgi:hypothetical protein
MHGLVRFGGKAVAAVGTMGPAGAIPLGLEEGNTATQKLRMDGVDTETAVKTGAVQGAFAAAGAVVPLGGKTVMQTLGLIGVGGPGSYIAQEALSRQILEKAGYANEASLHNPFDPLGLALSTLIPGGFGAVHMRGVKARGEAVTAGRVPLAQLTPQELRGLKYDDARLDSYASATAEKYGVPPALLLAVKNAGEKSGSTAVSGKGAQGVMQFMEGTAKDMGLKDRTDPVASIDAGARYLRQQFDKYGSWDAAVAHYNGGGIQGQLVKAGQRPSYNETAGYLDRVRAYMADHTAEVAATKPENVDAARVSVLNDTVAKALPDTPDAHAQMLKASDIVAERGGRAAEQEIAPVRRFQFAEEVTGSHDGQTDGTLTAMRDGESVGRVDYTVFDGSPQISMVDVPEGMRRQGVGRELVQEMQRRFPGQEIDWGMMTDDGAALRHSLKTIEQDVPEVQAKFLELEAAVRERTALEQRSAKFDAIEHPTPEQTAAHREFISQVGDRWNALHDRIDTLQAEVSGRKPTRTLIDTGEPVDVGPAREANNSLPAHDSVTLAGDEPAKRSAEVGQQATPKVSNGAGSEAEIKSQQATPEPSPTATLDTQLAQKLATEQPDLVVTLPGSDARLTVSEALARIAEDQKQDAQWADLVKVAAECALTAG